MKLTQRQRAGARRPSVEPRQTYGDPAIRAARKAQARVDRAKRRTK